MYICVICVYIAMDLKLSNDRKTSPQLYPRINPHHFIMPTCTVSRPPHERLLWCLGLPKPKIGRLLWCRGLLKPKIGGF